MSAHGPLRNLSVCEFAESGLEHKMALQLTVSTEEGEFAVLEVSPDAPIANIYTLVEVELGIPVAEQQLFVDGQALQQGDGTVAGSSLSNPNAMVLVRRRRVSARPSAGQVTPGNRFDQAAASLIAQVQADPRLVARLRFQMGDEIASAAQARNHAAVVQALQRQEALESDPFSPEAQKAIEERIRRENLQENMESSLEHNPESWATVVMLYVPVRINSASVVAFVDSGAQRTIISAKCAERIGVARLIDDRFNGTAHGVGTAKIVGRIHLTVLEVAGVHLECSFSVMDELGGIDVLLGLDMLRKHKAVIDLEQNKLRIGSSSVEFLHEKDIPNHRHANERPSR